MAVVLKHEQDIAVNITDNEALKIEEFTLYVFIFLLPFTKHATCWRIACYIRKRIS
jgi:hypothetical protein